MKIKIIAKQDLTTRFLKELKQSNIELDDNEYELLVLEPKIHKDSILGKYGNEYYILLAEDILFFKAIDNEVYCQTENKEYFVKEKLFELEALLYEKNFIRISKSYVINKKHILSIRPSINMKYIVKMRNDLKLEVTRTYYYQFKEFIGF